VYKLQTTKMAFYLEYSVRATVSQSLILKDEIMLELQKFVLQRVSDDTRLFRKELMKSIQWLSSPDVEKLKQWAIARFGNTHAEILKEVFCLIEA
jgi:hypothetical protein